ncbi:MAG: MFS transporter [Candidatus Sumerlaeaceae bacterium]|nr:MFS transporter [Candidatus Sumerlaeaceae bacterium]
MESSEAHSDPQRKQRDNKLQHFLKNSTTVRALRHRNYRLFFTGQVVSLIGSWMQSTAQGWLVYKLTSDPFLLGLTGFASQVPVLALGIFGGLAADVFNRHRLVIVTQWLLLLQAAVLAMLTIVTGADGQPLVEVWHVLVLSAFAGAVQAFDMPARQAFMVQLVDKTDINNAIALNSLSFNAARVIGPTLAGILIAVLQHFRPEHPTFGEGMCFVINAVSFVAVIGQLLRMDRASLPRMKTQTVESSLADGLDYLLGRRHLLNLILLAGLISFIALPYLVIMPAVAKDALGGDATTLGWLMTSVGVGAILGGLKQARRQRVRGLGKVIVRSLVGFSTVIFLTGFQRHSLLTCVGFLAAGFFMVNAMISCQVLVQALVSEAFRGRVMSYYTMMTIGMMPFGSLLVGTEAKHFGVSTSLMLTGVCTVVVALLFWLRLPAIRQAAQSSPEYAELLEREKG